MTINIKKILNTNISKYIDFMLYLADEANDNNDWPWEGGRSRFLSTDQLNQLVTHKNLSFKRKVKVFNSTANLYHDKKQDAKYKFGKVQSELINEVEQKLEDKELNFNILISMDNAWPIKSNEKPLVVGEIFAKIEFLQYLKNLDTKSKKKETPSFDYNKIEWNGDKKTLYYLIKSLTTKIKNKDGDPILGLYGEDDFYNFIVSTFNGFENVSPGTIRTELSKILTNPPARNRKIAKEIDQIVNTIMDATD